MERPDSALSLGVEELLCAVGGFCALNRNSAGGSASAEEFGMARSEAAALGRLAGAGRIRERVGHADQVESWVDRWNDLGRRSGFSASRHVGECQAKSLTYLGVLGFRA